MHPSKVRAYASAAALLGALLLAACGAARPAAPTLGESALVAADSALLEAGAGPPLPGGAAPDFSYRLPGGGEQRLSDLRGRLVLLNFWATWCGPCAAELPALQAAAAAHTDTLVVLGVNRLEPADTIAAFAGERGLTFPLVANESGDISDRYGARLLPTSYFINRDGTVGAVVRGPLAAGAIEQQLSALR